MAIAKTKQNSSAEVVGLHALSTDQSLSWLAERGKVSTSATELSRAWGWNARRAQRQLRNWHADGHITRRGRDIAVIGQPLVAASAATLAATQSDTVASLGDNRNDIAASPQQHGHPWALTLLILAPIAGLNVWPRLTQLLAGAIEPSGWAFVAFQVLALLLLAQILFAMERTQSWIARAAFVGFAVMLVAINMTFGVEAIGHVRDTTRDHNRAIADNIASLSRQLDERRNERASLQSFTPVTSGQIADAQKAVDDAVTARDQECGKVGDNCRKRVAELSDRQDKLSGLQSNKSIGDHAVDLDRGISTLEGRISALGPAPLEQDPTAARIAMLTLGMLSPDAISKGLPILLSLAAEI
jgi:hypothetical protein